MDIILDSFAEALKKSTSKKWFYREINSLLQKFWLKDLHKIELIKRTFWESLIFIIDKIDLKTLKTVLKNNREWLKKIFFTEDVDANIWSFVLTKIMIQLLAWVNKNNIRRRNRDNIKLWHLQRIANVLWKNDSAIKWIIWLIREKQELKTRRNIWALFNVFHRIATISPRSLVFLIENFKTSHNKKSSISNEGFINNNFWFVISEILPYILGKRKWSIAVDYFSEYWNRENFIRTIINK